MDWIWVIVPILSMTIPFAYAIARKWINYQMAEAQGAGKGASEIRRRLTEAEEALADSEQRLEKLEAIVVEQLLDASAEPATIEAGNKHQQSAV